MTLVNWQKRYEHETFHLSLQRYQTIKPSIKWSAWRVDCSYDISTLGDILLREAASAKDRQEQTRSTNQIDEIARPLLDPEKQLGTTFLLVRISQQQIRLTSTSFLSSTPLVLLWTNMGILEQLSGLLNEQVAQRGTGIVVAGAFAAFLVVTVVLNVLSQLLFKNPNEPPMVFHWLPIIGSTVTYGMDPYRFFFECRAKVCCPCTASLSS
jgi:hypothetical protein